MDQMTLERIKTAHPRVREQLSVLYKRANNRLGKNVRLRFTRVYSTAAEQDELFAIGRTKRGKKVTNAKAWQSIHNYGLAFDIVLLIDMDGNGTFETASWDMLKDWDKDTQADWMEVVAIFKEAGWEWGGDWKKFADGPHFQYTFGFDWKTLKARVDKGIIIKDTNGFIYPKI